MEVDKDRVLLPCSKLCFERQNRNPLIWTCLFILHHLALTWLYLTGIIETRNRKCALQKGYRHIESKKRTLGLALFLAHWAVRHYNTGQCMFGIFRVLKCRMFCLLSEPSLPEAPIQSPGIWRKDF